MQAFLSSADFFLRRIQIRHMSCQAQGLIQDFLIGGSNLQLLILPDYYFSLIFLKILHENEIISSQRGVLAIAQDPPLPLRNFVLQIGGVLELF